MLSSYHFIYLFIVVVYTEGFVTFPSDYSSTNCSRVLDPSTTGTVLSNCTTLEVTYRDHFVSSSCPNIVVQRLWNVTCDNSILTSTQTISYTVNDLTGPTIHVTSPVSVDCAGGTAPSSTGTPVVTDNCDLQPSLSYVSISPSCAYGYTILRNWTATDFCGNTKSVVQSINVVGSIGSPNIALFKPTKQSSQLNGYTGASLAVDGNTSPDFSNTALNSISQTNSTELSAFWEVDLQTNYHITRIVVWNRGDALMGSISDARLFFLSATRTTLTSSDFLMGPPQLNYTWNGFVDNVRYIYIQKTTSPILSLAEVEVYSTLPYPYEGCYGLVLNSKAVLQKPQCPYPERDYAFSDPANIITTVTTSSYDKCCEECGNILNSNTFPNGTQGNVCASYSWDSNTLSCSLFGSIPTSSRSYSPGSVNGIISITPDLCADLCNGYTYFGITRGRECVCFDERNYPFTLSLSADEFECNTKCTSYSRWNDGNLDWSCGGSQYVSLYYSNVPIVPDITVTCQNATLSNPTIKAPLCSNGLSYSTSESDTYTQTTQTTLTVSDQCGWSRTISYSKTSINFPSISPPPNTTAQCGFLDPSLTGNATYTTPCGFGEVDFADTFNSGSCPGNYTIFRKWFITDSQNQTTETVQVISVFDTEVPILSIENTNATCSTISPSYTGEPIINESCTSNGEITPTYTDTRTSCSNNIFNVYRHWVATDPCRNSNNITQTIQVTDKEAPSISISDYSLSCSPGGVNTSVSILGVPLVTDNCDNTVTATYSDQITNQNGPNCYTIIRTWSTSDFCGNSQSLSQKITVSDDTAPVLNVPAGYTTTCSSSISPSVVTAVDNCDSNPTISLNEVIVPQICNQKRTIYRNFKATDSCGKETSHTQTITVDIPDPIISWPTDFVINTCGKSLSTHDVSPDLTGFPTVTIGCNIDSFLSYIDNPQSGGLLREWKVRDECGRTYFHNQSLVITEDSISPTATFPSDITIYCNGSISPSQTGSPEWQDNCQNATISYTDKIQPSPFCTSDTIYERTWTVSDGYNSISSTQRITSSVIQDVYWSPIVPYETDCLRLSPQFTGLPLAKDQCDRSLSVTWADYQDSLFSIPTPASHNFCNSTQVFYRKFTSSCSSSSQEQTITVDPSKMQFPIPPSLPNSHGVYPTCTCPNGVCVNSTECTRCNAGYYGLDCSSPCSCLHGICDSGVTSDGSCVECHSGFYGTSCDKRCTCVHGTCSEGTLGNGECLSCDDGYYGSTCSKSCACTQNTICLDGIFGSGACLANEASTTSVLSSSVDTTFRFLIGGLIVLIAMLVLAILTVVIIYKLHRARSEKHLIKWTQVDNPEDENAAGDAEGGPGVAVPMKEKSKGSEKSNSSKSDKPATPGNPSEAGKGAKVSTKSKEKSKEESSKSGKGKAIAGSVKESPGSFKNKSEDSGGKHSTSIGQNRGSGTNRSDASDASKSEKSEHKSDKSEDKSEKKAEKSEKKSEKSEKKSEKSESKSEHSSKQSDESKSE